MVCFTLARTQGYILWLREMMDREAWQAAVHGAQRVGHDLATEQHRRMYLSEQ